MKQQRFAEANLSRLIWRVYPKTAGPYLNWQKVCGSKRKMQTKLLKRRRSLKKFGQKPISPFPLPVSANRRRDYLRTQAKIRRADVSQTEGETYSFA